MQAPTPTYSTFQGVNNNIIITASIQMYGIYISGKCPSCRPKLILLVENYKGLMILNFEQFLNIRQICCAKLIYSKPITSLQAVVIIIMHVCVLHCQTQYFLLL